MNILLTLEKYFINIHILELYFRKMYNTNIKMYPVYLKGGRLVMTMLH